MSNQTPQFTEKILLRLHFDEYGLQRLLEGSIAQSVQQKREPVMVKCTVVDLKSNLTVDCFEIDASRCPKRRLATLSDAECRLRTFFYLNGLLNALQKTRLRFRSAPSLIVETNVRYLQSNASAERIAKWKKSGYKRADGEQIQLRALWNEFYLWCTGPVAFCPLTVVVPQQQ